MDACAEAISTSYLDQYVSGTNLDIDTKAGLELEQMVGLFGFGRLQGRRATGLVHMELSVAATQDVFVQSAAQFFVPGGSMATGVPLYFAATQPAVIAKGTYVTDIPVQCTQAGSIGNVSPGSISSIGVSIGSTSVTNLTPMTGGIDVESDDELRARFKATFLRNIAGTTDFYTALCIANQFVSKVAVYGPVTLYRTQVAAPSGAVTLPVHQDVKYVWAQSETVFKNLAQPGEVFYTPTVDYTFTGGSSAQLTRIPAGVMVAGQIVDVEFEYTTRSSRNDPTVAGLTNKVDIFVNGSDPFNVTERTVVSNTTFSSTASNELWTGNFIRVGTVNTPPSVANRFMRLGSTPILAFPTALTIKDPNTSVTTVYTQGVHYHVLRGTTLLAGSEREVAGIEWLPAGPANATPVTLTYSYNRLPQLLNSLLKVKKQITTDVLVHQADYRYMRLYLDIEYDRGYSIEQANANLQNSLRAFFTSLYFGAWIELSDIIMVAHQVIGIDNVTFTTSASNPTDYGIKIYNLPEGTSPLSTNATDFKLTDNQLPIFLEAVVTRKANR